MPRASAVGRPGRSRRIRVGCSRCRAMRAMVAVQLSCSVHATHQAPHSGTARFWTADAVLQRSERGLLLSPHRKVH